MAKYSIAVEIGSLSSKAILVDVENGNVLAHSQDNYHSVLIKDKLPDSEIALPRGFVLHNPHNYFEVLKSTIPDVIRLSKVNSKDIISLGINFRSSVLLPLDRENQALCTNSDFTEHPHAWPKPREFTVAQKYADIVNATAEKTNAKCLSKYGGRISRECIFAKILQIIVEDPDLYEATDNFMEASDWLVSQLTGTVIRNASTMGYYAMYHHRDGFPKQDFFEKLSPKMKQITKEKINGKIMNLGEKAGTLTSEWAENLGLNSDVSVAVGSIDFQTYAPAIKLITPGDLLMVIASNSFDLLLAREDYPVDRISGIVYNGIIPGYHGYKANQSPITTSMDWFMNNFIRESLILKSRSESRNINTMMEDLALSLTPGESGLLALNWLSGDQGMLSDTELSGLLIGLDNQTRVEEIYRALIEASAFEKRLVLESLKDARIQVRSLSAYGEKPYFGKLVLQIYADVLNREINVYEKPDLSLLGCAILATVAAKVNGGHPNVLQASSKMSVKSDLVYRPDPKNVEVYNILFQEYKKLRDYYGKNNNNVMKKLIEIKNRG